MVDPGEMRRRARRVYERRKGDWVRDLVVDGLSWRDCGDTAAAAIEGGAESVKGADPTFEVNLAPPTRREVIEDIEGVAKWVGRWEAYTGPGEVIWEERRWSGLGTQRIPVRVRLGDIEAISRAAGCAAEWLLLAKRTGDLVGLADDRPARRLSDSGGPSGPSGLPGTARRLTSVIASTPERDWQMALEVLRWLGDHQGLSCYIRELQIRGIDTKWVEGHRKLVVELAGALYGLDRLPFRRPPELIRVRALGEGILPKGFEDASLTAAELSSIETHPARVVVCENLISVLTMPRMAGTLALFGSGYGVGSRLAIPWLDEMELYYWGDLDTHGFRILDGFRKHHPSAVSVLMDEATLLACEDLWVEESEPYRGALDRLTTAEKGVYEFLCRRSPAPRLEQERIPFAQVRSAFSAIAGR